MISQQPFLKFRAWGAIAAYLLMACIAYARQYFKEFMSLPYQKVGTGWKAEMND